MTSLMVSRHSGESGVWHNGSMQASLTSFLKFVGVSLLGKGRALCLPCLVLESPDVKFSEHVFRLFFCCGFSFISMVGKDPMFALLMVTIDLTSGISRRDPS